MACWLVGTIQSCMDMHPPASSKIWSKEAIIELLNAVGWRLSAHEPQDWACTTQQISSKLQFDRAFECCEQTDQCAHDGEHKVLKVQTLENTLAHTKSFSSKTAARHSLGGRVAPLSPYVRSVVGLGFISSSVQAKASNSWGHTSWPIEALPRAIGKVVRNLSVPAQCQGSRN